MNNSTIPTPVIFVVVHSLHNFITVAKMKKEKQKSKEMKY